MNLFKKPQTDDLCDFMLLYFVILRIHPRDVLDTKFDNFKFKKCIVYVFDLCMDSVYQIYLNGKFK